MYGQKTEEGVCLFLHEIFKSVSRAAAELSGLSIAAVQPIETGEPKDVESEVADGAVAAALTA
jgi:hypothetical protein